MIPAAPSSAPPAPCALKHLRVPPAELVLGEGIGRQVADLQPGELPHEVPERHPVGSRQGLGPGHCWGAGRRAQVPLDPDNILEELSDSKIFYPEQL